MTEGRMPRRINLVALRRRNDDLARRIERTMQYLDELAAGPLTPDACIIVDAARASLTTPARTSGSGDDT